MSEPQFPADRREALAALLERFGSSIESFLALRSDSYEHALASHSLEHLEQLYVSLLTPGLSIELARDQCPPWPPGWPRAGRLPSTGALSQIAERLRTEAALNDLGRVSTFLDKLRSRAGALPVGKQDQVLDTIVTLVGEELIQAKLSGGAVTAALPAVDRLLMAESGRTKVRLEEEKIQLRREAEARHRERLKLDLQRWRRETCELFLKWSQEQRARDIAASPGTNADKIEALGRVMFGEDWAS